LRLGEFPSEGGVWRAKSYDYGEEERGGRGHKKGGRSKGGQRKRHKTKSPERILGLGGIRGKREKKGAEGKKEKVFINHSPQRSGAWGRRRVGIGGGFIDGEEGKKKTHGGHERKGGRELLIVLTSGQATENRIRRGRGKGKKERKKGVERMRQAKGEKREPSIYSLFRKKGEVSRG